MSALLRLVPFALAWVICLNQGLATITVDAAPRFAKRASLATVYTSCNVPNTVALTFDDGPYIYQKEISTVLKNAQVKGTFFVNGNNFACIYDEQQVASLKDAYNDGHMIASHTWAHKDLTSLSRDQIGSEMSRVDEALKKILGVTTAFMRPPYGNSNDLVREVAGERKQSIVLWDFDSGDSVGASVAQSDTAYDELAMKHPKNILALNHETLETTAKEVLPYAIKKLKEQNYEFVTVAECLGLSPYLAVGEPQARDSSWQC